MLRGLLGLKHRPQCIALDQAREFLIILVISLPSTGDNTPGCQDDVLVVMTTPAVCSDTALESELEKLQNGGRRAVCIWPGSTEGAELPEAAKKYAYSIVPWDPKKLSAVLADDDVTCFESQAGEPLPKAPMEHNLCVDEPKKPK